MPLIYQKWISRDDLQANPEARYVFGDNTQRRGLGGQAKEMRGEPNAIGIVTKWYPDTPNAAFFRDDDFHIDIIHQGVNDDLEMVMEAIEQKRTVIWPLDGIGTGLSRLPQNAPDLWGAMEHARKEIEQYGKELQ
jgi:hypothetical protein